jgi:hypothetical protein
MFRDSACECGRAFIIETCAIDQCLIFRESKQSWSWIAGLRMISNGTCFDETEAECGEWL